MQFSKIIILFFTAAFLAICTIAAPYGFCEDINGNYALQNKRALEMYPDLAGLVALEEKGNLVPSSSSSVSSSTHSHSQKTAKSSSATRTEPYNAKKHASPSSAISRSHGPMILKTVTTVYTSPTDSSYASFVPSQCDWSTGILEDGEGKKACVVLCKDKFGDQKKCDGSRCIAIDGSMKPGKCFCTCTCPKV